MQRNGPGDDMTNGVGSAIRNTRTGSGKSLTEVAAEAGISAATLSRIETNKQSIDVHLLTRIAEILSVEAADFLRDSEGQKDTEESLVRALSERSAGERARIVAAAGRQNHARRTSRDLSLQLDTLLATVDIMRQELTEMQKRAHKRRR